MKRGKRKSEIYSERMRESEKAKQRKKDKKK